MSIVRAYLFNPNVQAILKRQQKDKGFSLIELVVVIAVLAVLTAIALPNFLGVSEDASARTAQQAVLNAFKECKVLWARNKRGSTSEFEIPAVTDWAVMAQPASTSFAPPTYRSQPVANTSVLVKCFDSNEAGQDLYVVPSSTKFPTYKIAETGVKSCRTGNATAGPDTFNIGCDSTSNNAVVTGWK